MDNARWNETPMKDRNNGDSESREPGMKEAYCNNCKTFTPLVEGPLETDDETPYPWGDLLCGECCLIQNADTWMNRC